MQGPKKYNVVLVAGSGAASYKVNHQHKAFLRINQKCIINYVVEALLQVEAVQEIYVVGSGDKLRQTLEEGGINLFFPKKIHLVEQKNNLYKNIWFTFLKMIPADERENNLEHSVYRDKAVLIVPCDSPLLLPHEVNYFISHCDMERYDHVMGLTAEENLRPFYPRDGQPGIKMAYLHLKEKSYRINNLHLVKPLKILNRKYIQRMYQFRYQRNIRNVLQFGWSLYGKDKIENYKYYIGLLMSLFFASFGAEAMVRYFKSWTPKQGIERSISKIMGTRFMGLEVPYAGAALDIDNAKDYEAMKARFNEWREFLSQQALPSRIAVNSAFNKI